MVFIEYIPLYQLSCNSTNTNLLYYFKDNFLKIICNEGGAKGRGHLFRKDRQPQEREDLSCLNNSLNHLELGHEIWMAGVV